MIGLLILFVTYILGVITAICILDDIGIKDEKWLIYRHPHVMSILSWILVVVLLIYQSGKENNV